MFGDPIDIKDIPKDAIILRSHWNYVVKRSGQRRSRLCCNGSKKACPELHEVASTWSSCVELPIQRLFLGICAHQNLAIYGADAQDAYAHEEADGNTYLAIDDAYADWYYNKYGKSVDRKYVLPVKHALQGHPKSGKFWMHLIDKVLIKELGFKTTTHDRCIYMRTRNGKPEYILRQVDDFLIGCTDEKTAKTLTNDIGLKIQLPAEKKDGVNPMEYLGLVKDYNGVEITQTSHYNEMSCGNYIERLCKSHGWDTNSPYLLPAEVYTLLAPEAQDIAVNKMEIPKDGPYPSTMSSSTELPNELTSPVPTNDGTKINTVPKSKFRDAFKVSKSVAPLPMDCLDPLYSELGPTEGTTEHLALEKAKGFAY